MLQTTQFIVGAILRRAFRRQLLSRGIAFTEDKGWLDSLFVVTGTSGQLMVVQRIAQRVNAT